jgi:hypothetical protein
VVWLCRAQAAALIAGAATLLVLAGTSHRTLAAAYLATVVAVAVAVAALLVWGPGRRRARTPILLTELLAVLISTQVWTSGREALAVDIGLPALVVVVLIGATVRGPRG